MKKTFDEVVLFARTGLNPRQNFKLGQGKNKYITIKNIKNNKLTVDDNTDVVDDDAIKMIHKRSQIKKGDILFASIGRMGDMYILEEEPVGWDINESVFAFTLDTNIVRQKYFYYIFRVKTTLDYLASNSSGSTFKSIKMNQLKRMVFDIPSIEEQDRIIATLDMVCNVIEMRKRELISLDKLIKARFVEMFGTIHDNKFEYDICTIQSVCEQIKDGTHQTPEYTDDIINGFKFLSSKDVTSGKINWDGIKYIPECLHNNLYKRIAPRKGDILLAKNGTTGVAAIVDVDEIFDIYVSLALLRPIEMNSIYLCAAINSQETKEQFNRSLKGIGVPNLHLGEIKKTKILNPPIKMQNEFANFVAQVDKSKLTLCRYNINVNK